MPNLPHIGICSVFFDARPEGICTGRLIRALLDAGYRVTLYTSEKAQLGYQHPKLCVRVFAVRWRKPLALYRYLARWRGHLPNNYYSWGRRVAQASHADQSLPDVFYGRAWPQASWVPAHALAERFDKPLLLHFSDPFPPPNEAMPAAAFMLDLQTMVSRAAGLSFTNQVSVDYQARFLSFAAERATVLPHVAPSPCDLGPAPKAVNLVFIGSLSVSRPADALLAGFAEYHRQRPEARLSFVGTSARYLQPLLARYGLGEAVSVLPFTAEVQASMRQASALISIDAPVLEPVFTPTKIIEYLGVNRKILAITPPSSPVEGLLRAHPESTVVVNQYSASAVAEGLMALEHLSPEPAAFDQRFASMAPFSPTGVAETFTQWLRATQVHAPTEPTGV